MATTHEQYVQAIYRLALKAKLTQQQKSVLRQVKITYGDRRPGVYGTTHFGQWHPTACCGGKRKPKGHAHPLVTIAAMPGETSLELCNTVVHELGHVLAGIGKGHGPEWVAACKALGLANAKAMGAADGWSDFSPALRKGLRGLGLPTDGAPIAVKLALNDSGVPELVPADPGPRPVRTCGAGIGTKGGKSRGAGAGSRYLLWECQCEQPTKLRTTRKDLRVRCLDCKRNFALVESSIPPAQQ